MQTFFESDEEEKFYNLMLEKMKKIKMLEFFDYQIFVIAILFHNEYHEDVQQFMCFRNLLLSILQKKLRETYPEFDALRVYLELADMLKTYSQFARCRRVFNALR